jgi:hypothetical protein
MRLNGFGAAVGSVAALVGFAGAANASATIDLIWAVNGTNEIGPDINDSSVITLQVVLTAGPNGSQGAGVSVDYSGILPGISVTTFAATVGGPLPLLLGTLSDTGSRIENVNSASFPPFVGTGLAAGQSHQLGTVTFHKNDLLANGVFELRSDANGPTDDVLDLGGNVITSRTTFNSAYIVYIFDPQPLCDFAIEINALRGGSPTVSVNSTKGITAKARIRKGSAVDGTTIETQLRIDAIDGEQVIDTQLSGLIRLGVGKGGKGDKLSMNIPRCNSGSIDFDATFSGFDADGDLCTETRRITKVCK